MFNLQVKKDEKVLYDNAFKYNTNIIPTFSKCEDGNYALKITCSEEEKEELLNDVECEKRMTKTKYPVVTFETATNPEKIKLLKQVKSANGFAVRREDTDRYDRYLSQIE